MAPKLPPRRTFDPIATEAVLADLASVIKKKGFMTPAEAQAFLGKVLKASGGQLPAPRERTPLEQAQTVMYQAFEATERDERLRLAGEALKLSGDCADAYFLQAMDGDGTNDEKLALYEAAVKAGERALGPDAFTRWEGIFGQVMETRPYLRARFQLARCLWWSNRRREAVAHAEDLLRLNEDDNQGVRYFVLGCYAHLEQMDRIKALLARPRFRSDASPEWTYSKALVKFSEEGRSRSSARLLTEAIRWNKHVPACLLGAQPLPKEIPEMIAAGEPSEAASYVRGFGFMWEKVPGALDWLRERTKKTSAKDRIARA